MAQKSSIRKTFIIVVGVLGMISVYIYNINIKNKFKMDVHKHHVENKGHVACLNLYFNVNNIVSVWSMITDSKNYIQGAIKLGNSILRHSTIPVDLVVMELSNQPLTKADKLALKRNGWKICTVERIKPRNEAGTYPQFRDQFTKLHLWNMTSYKTIIYFDSDALVVGNIDNFISMNLNSSKLGVSRDIRRGAWTDTFNMGVFVIHPDEKELKRLLALKEDPNVKFETTMSEQGFLNVVYKNLWHEIGFIYNANLAVYSQKRKFWDNFQKDIRVIHYTMEKPWQCGETYKSVCDIWRKAS